MFLIEPDADAMEITVGPGIVNTLYHFVLNSFTYDTTIIRTYNGSYTLKHHNDYIILFYNGNNYKLIDNIGGVLPYKNMLNQQKLNPVVEDGVMFGYSVSLSGDGNTCIIGTPFENNGGNNRGSSYIFIRTLGVWTLEQKLAPVVEDDALFGSSVSLNGNGNTCIIGTPNEDNGGNNRGSD